jgi:hypothetical protein
VTKKARFLTQSILFIALPFGVCHYYCLKSWYKFDLDWFGLVWFGLVWFGLIWIGLVWFGLVWFGLDWFGLVWIGLVWFGLVWFGLVWFGLDRAPLRIPGWPQSFQQKLLAAQPHRCWD